MPLARLPGRLRLHIPGVALRFHLVHVLSEPSSDTLAIAHSSSQLKGVELGSRAEFLEFINRFVDEVQ